MNSLDSISKTLRLEIELSKNNIDYSLSNKNGFTEVIIPMDSVKDKTKLNNVMAEFYEQQSLFDKSGFSSFLAKCYRGEIK